MVRQQTQIGEWPCATGLSQELNHADDDWVGALRGEAPNEAWFEFANEMIQHAGRTSQAESKRLTVVERDCRENLYDNMFGFGIETAPSYRLGDRFFKKQRAHAPPHRFVSTMRVFSQEAMDVVKSSMAFPESWEMADETLLERIVALKNSSFGSARSQLILQRSARVLAVRDYASKAEQLGAQISEALCWSPKKATDVIVAKPTLPSGNKTKLDLALLYASEYASSHISVAMIGNLLIENPDKHLVALELGADYTPTYIRNATEGMDPSDCRAEAQAILGSATRSSQFGSVIADAHRQYHEIGRPPRSKIKATE